MINTLPWLLILSNGSVKLQYLDKYQRWRNICGATQRHNEGKAAGAYRLQQREGCCIQAQIQGQQQSAHLCICSEKYLVNKIYH